MTLAPVLSILFLSTLVQSTFSFGGALVALPLLAFFIEIKAAIPLLTMLSTSIALVIVFQHWREIQIKNAWRLIVSACVGIPFGILFLVHVEGSILKVVLAVTVIVSTLLNIFSPKSIRMTNVNYAFPFGLVSGLFGGAYNISGPPVVLYASLMNWSPAFFRATIQSYALFTNIFAIAGHALAGNITQEVFTYYVYALPIVGLSLWLGNLIHRSIPSEKYAIVVKILLIVLGCHLLFSSITH